MVWVKVSQDRVKWLAFLNIAMSSKFLQNAGISRPTKQLLTYEPVLEIRFHVLQALQMYEPCRRQF